MKERKNSGLGIAGMIIGIVSVLSVCMCIGGFTAVIGLILSIIAITNVNTKKGCAIAGIILNSIALVILIILIIVVSNNSETSTTTSTTGTVTTTTQTTPAPTPKPTATPTATPTVEPTATPEPTPTPTPTPTPEPTLSPEEIEEEYKESCQEFKYKDVLRNPDDYIGERIKITVEISTVFNEDWLTPTRYYFTYAETEPGSGYYWGDMYAIFDTRVDDSLKLLEDDIIVVYGEISSPQETESLIVNSEEVFCIDMKYVELIGE